MQRKFAEALENYQKELEFAGKAEDAGSELAAAQYHVANGLWGVGRMEEAAAVYEKAENSYKQAAQHIGSEFLKNEYAKHLQHVLSDHAAMLRMMGKTTAADSLDKEAAAIVIKPNLRD
jgi:tetratricopeptide (TPR) repeat protein